MATGNSGIRNSTGPGTMNGGEGVPLNLTGKQMGLPWPSAGNKGGHPVVGHHHPLQHHQSPQTMPLSPPLTPLPPNSARFPPSLVLPPQSSFNPAANLQQLLLAAQCNPFLKNAGMPAMPPFSMSPEIMENVQKILQLRHQQQQQDLQKGDKESDWVETDDEIETTKKPASIESSPISNNNNHSNKTTFGERSSKSDEELKREEEMLEDEMKEEEDESSEDEKKQLDIAESLRAVFMKRILEDFSNKSATGVKQMIPNPAPPTDPMSQQDGRPLFQAGEIPCKFSCGKTFSSVLDLFNHQDGNCTRTVMTLGEDNERDNVVTDDDMMSEMGDQDSQDDLNTSGNNSSVGGGERKVRVRTLISDEQLVVLRAFYMINPRPKREELEKVAAKIGHPFKVRFIL